MIRFISGNRISPGSCFTKVYIFRKHIAHSANIQALYFSCKGENTLFGRVYFDTAKINSSHNSRGTKGWSGNFAFFLLPAVFKLISAEPNSTNALSFHRHPPSFPGWIVQSALLSITAAVISIYIIIIFEVSSHHSRYLPLQPKPKYGRSCNAPNLLSKD
jgi:hypothetical protein